MKGKVRYYDPKEEKLNIWSHFAGFLLAILGLVLLLIKGIQLKSALHIVSYSIYGLSMIVLYLASTLYHSSKEPGLRQRLNVFDHSAIYVLIAGTYTPYTLLGLGGAWGWSIFGVVWGLAIAGIIFKLFFAGRFDLLSTIGYLLMGWLIVIAIKPLINSLNTPTLIYLALGGISYTIGAILYSFKKMPYNHAIFHIFVLAGSIFHYLGVYYYL